MPTNHNSDPVALNDMEAILGGTKSVATKKHDDHDDHDSGLSLRTPFKGIIDDVKRTVLTHWCKEMTVVNQKVIAVSFFLFFACITPAIAFGGLYEKLTNKWIGVTEMIAATAWCGLVYALIGGMPMFINGGTGPVLAFTGVLYQVSKSMDIPFLPFNAWVGIWVGIYLFISAIFNLNQHLRVVSRFTDEIFAGLISIIFIVSAATGLFGYFDDGHKSHAVMFKKINAAHFNDTSIVYTPGMDVPNGVDYSHWAVALLALVSGVMTCVIAIVLRGMRNSPYFVKPVRDLLADFGTIIAILIMVLVDIYLLPDIDTERLTAPDDFAPTFSCCDSSCTKLWPDECNTTTLASYDAANPIRRPWLVDLGDLNGKAWMPIFAAVPAFLAFILVFLDDGITWHLVNKKDNKLTHGAAFHWDTIVIAICIVVNSLLGLPWLVAATVRSINHVQSLAEKKVVTENGHSREVIDFVHQQRVSNLLIHGLVLASVFAMSVVKSIPMPVLYGVFLYMGLVSLWSNQFYVRITMLIMQPSLFPPTLFTSGSTKVSASQMHKFTLIQLVLFAILFAVKSIKEIAIAFPVIIALCVPIRMYLLPKYFTEQELNALDNASEEQEPEEKAKAAGK